MICKNHNNRELETVIEKELGMCESCIEKLKAHIPNHCPICESPCLFTGGRNGNVYCPDCGYSE